LKNGPVEHRVFHIDAGGNSIGMTAKASVKLKVAHLVGR
jgi:hypothetical protein